MPRFKTRSRRSIRTVVVFMQAGMLPPVVLLPKIGTEVYRYVQSAVRDMAVVEENTTPDESDNEDRHFFNANSLNIFRLSYQYLQYIPLLCKHDQELIVGSETIYVIRMYS